MAASQQAIRHGPDIEPATASPAPRGGSFGANPLLLAASVLVPLLLFAAIAWQSRIDISDDFERRAMRSVATVQEHAQKVFEIQELIMDRAISLARAVGHDRLPGQQQYLHDEFVDMVDGMSQAVGIAIWDAEGKPLAMSNMNPPPAGMEIADRDYFRAHRAADVGLLFTGPTRAQLSGADLVVLSRRLPLHDGAFAGVAVVSLRTAYFADFYAGILRDSPHDAVSLFREEGTLLARHPPLPEATVLPATAQFFTERLARRDAGVYRGQSAFDHADRVFAYRKVGRYPLYVSYSIATAGEVEEWLARLRLYGLFSLLAMAGLLGAAFVARRQGRQAAAAELRRAEEAAHRRQLERELAQARRVEVLGLLTGGVAHDFNNCLAIVVGNVERAQKLTDADSAAARPLKLALVGATRASQLTRRLTTFARRQQLQPQDIDPGEVVGEVAALAKSTFPSNIAIRLEVDQATAAVFVDPSQFENALLNLFINARDAMPSGGGELRVRAMDGANWPGDAPPGLDVIECVVIEVADTGAGMTDAVLARAFEPFFTTKVESGGSGLGLAQVYGFVRQSGGHVAVKSREGFGTSVVLWLPRHGAAAATP